MDGDPTLPFDTPQPEQHASAPAEDDPLIYVASPLTRIATQADRLLITSLVGQIVTVVVDCEDGGKQLFRTHAPAVRSAPWVAKDRTPEDIYRSNSRLLLTEVDALIMLSLDGGSDGTGQEMALANQIGMPVLRLSPSEDPISRQVSGNPLVDAAPFDLPETMADHVRHFLATRRTAICSGPRNRRSQSIIYAPLQQDLNQKWSAISSVTERGRVAGSAGTQPKNLDHVLSHPLLLASFGHRQLLQVGSTLGIDVPSYFSEFTDLLSISQTEALFVAKDEFGFSDQETARLQRTARRQLASPGTKRLLLNNPADWLRLKETDIS